MRFSPRTLAIALILCLAAAGTLTHAHFADHKTDAHCAVCASGGAAKALSRIEPPVVVPLRHATPPFRIAGTPCVRARRLASIRAPPPLTVA